MLNICKLYELMNELDIKSLKQLSSKTKIPYSTIMYMMEGHDMHVSTIVELAKYFKVPVDYLINTSYGICVIDDKNEQFIKTSSVIEAAFLSML